MSNVERDPIYLAAADWFARLREPEVSMDEMLAWQQWIGAHEAHARAFAQVEQVSAILCMTQRPTLPSAVKEKRDSYDASIPLSDWRAHARPRFNYALAASVIVAAAIAGWLVLRPSSGDVLRTAVGENRMVALTDGSTVILGGDSALKSALDEKTRSFELVRGEAFFKVAKDPSRPFEVLAGNANVIAVGTEFNVRRGADRTVVAVVEGRVIVEPSAAKARGSAVSVIAGEQTMVSGAGVAAPAPSTDPSAATAWQSGRLAFHLETLRHVLEDVNRYAPKPVVVEDEAVGNLRVTATVVGGNVQGLIASMEEAFGLEAVEEPDRILLRLRS